MNTKYKWTQIVAISILCCLSMVLHAASSPNPGDKNGTASISGTGGIATRAFTGVWSQSSDANQNTVVQMVSNGSGGLNAIVYWFGFDNYSMPFWYFAEGPVTDNYAELTIYAATNSLLLPTARAYDDNLMASTMGVKSHRGSLQVWGTGTIEFENCGEGTFSGTRSISGTGGFRFRIEKVSDVADLSCAGGTSDGVNPSDNPIDIRSFFTATTAGTGSSGKAEFEISGGRTNFEVGIEDLPEGNYELIVDGVNQGRIKVKSLPTGGTKGEIEFRSPVESGKVLLTFDPRNKLIDVTDSKSTVVLTQIFPLETPIDDGGLPGGDEQEIDIEMTNAGIYPAGDAKAEFEQRPDRTEFSVEVEDIPVGDYELWVGKVLRGTITVVSVLGGTEGEIEFRNPVEPGKSLLDFDPRDQLIEVMEGSTLLFSTDLVPGAGNDNGGDDGGGDDNVGDDNGGDDGGDDNGGDNGGGEQEIVIEMTNAGKYPAGDAKARFEQRPDRSEFSVEVEGIPVGDYELLVGSVSRGTITVVSVLGGTEGEIEFRNPVEPGKSLLDFDPRDQLIEVMEDGTLLFSTDLVP